MQTAQTLRPMLEETLDWDAVLDQIADEASFSLSQQAVKEALPLTERREMEYQLSLAREGIELERTARSPEFGGISDISKEVEAARKGVVLSAPELNAIALFCARMDTLSHSVPAEIAPELASLAASISPLPRLKKAIEARVDISGNIREDATPKLQGLAGKLNAARAQLSQSARAFLKRNSSRLMENMTTTIDGRTCVLVKAADKNAFGGILHGTSQSGLAYYIEPSAFVELNQKIQEIQLDIQEEKQRICRELSGLVGQDAFALLSDLETVTLMDFAMSKARYAVRREACIPRLQERDHSLVLKNARHPLLDPQSAVANTYELKGNQACLMISGPNMGGKTVTMKTLGLFAALAHAGFPVLADEALLPLFADFWVDIGDRQSIQENLSTFSSHMTRLSSILKQAGPHSFVLLDEIGNGTDPVEGASLAAAILEALMDKGALVITTTHYSQVKAFGKASPRVLVSSVEFDPQTMRPTYRYVPGISGASYAFSIARACDLPEEVISKARAIKAEQEGESQRQLEALEKQQNQVRREKERFDALIQDAHRLQKEAAKEKEEAEKERRRLQEDYDRNLQAMVDRKEAEARELIERLKDMKAAPDHEMSDALHDIRSLAKTEPREEPKEKVFTFALGDHVMIPNLGLHGEITEIRKKEANVLIHGRKTRVKLKDLVPMDNTPNQKKVKQRAQKEDKVFVRFPLELNIIGERVDDGLTALDNYLDQAVYRNVKQVRIIHGMGTGALRNAVWQALKRHPQVKGFSAGGPSEGGLGATVVQLK